MTLLRKRASDRADQKEGLYINQDDCRRTRLQEGTDFQERREMASNNGSRFD